jgi:hypothetical protein
VCSSSVGVNQCFRGLCVVICCFLVVFSKSCLVFDRRASSATRSFSSPLRATRDETLQLPRMARWWRRAAKRTPFVRLVGTKSPFEMPAKKEARQQHCQHGRRRSTCKECGGGSVCQHGRLRSTCKECVGGSVCQHGRQRSLCKDCGGGSVCQHGRQRSLCKDCVGGSVCQHGSLRSTCKDCGGGSICQHGRERRRCKDCGGSSSDEGSMRKRDRVRV